MRYKVLARRSVWLGLLVVLAPLIGLNRDGAAVAAGGTARLERTSGNGLKLTLTRGQQRSGQVRIQVGDGRSYKVSALTGGPNHPGRGDACRLATLDFYCEYFKDDPQSFTVQFQTDPRLPDET